MEGKTGWYQTYQNVKAHFKHKAFEDLIDKKPPSEKKGKPKPKKESQEAWAFLADSETASSSGDEADEVHYQTHERCPECQGAHPLYKCEAFFMKPPLQRRLLVTRWDLCLVCYGPGHNARDCRFTMYKCHFGCRSRHNKDLHLTEEEFKKFVEANTEARSSRAQEDASAQLTNLVYSMDQSQSGEEEDDNVLFMASKGRKIKAQDEPRKPKRPLAITTLSTFVSNPENGKVERVSAMADTGASNTHVSGGLRRHLGLQGKVKPFLVGSHGGKVQEYLALDSAVTLCMVDGSYQRHVPV